MKPIGTVDLTTNIPFGFILKEYSAKFTIKSFQIDFCSLKSVGKQQKMISAFNKAFFLLFDAFNLRFSLLRNVVISSSSGGFICIYFLSYYYLFQGQLH